MSGAIAQVRPDPSADMTPWIACTDDRITSPSTMIVSSP